MIRVRLSETDLLEMVEETREQLLVAIGPRVLKGVEVIVDAAKANLRKRRGTPGTVAPAGEPPEYDEGELHDSIKVGRLTRSKYGVRWAYGSYHPAAWLHEFGGTTKGTVKRLYPARPYIRPAEASTQAEVERILEDL